jgi:DNA-nicking Smr family endonuclease
VAVAVVSADDGKPRRRRLTDEEHRLWGRFTRSVAPLRQRPAPADPVQPAAMRSKANPVLVPRAGAVVRGSAPAPKQAAQLEPLDRRLKRRLARGGQSIDARIDLHGRTQGEAHAALLRFLRKAQRDAAKVVLVITGKGAPARDSWSERGVLKRQVPQWLKLPELRAYVLGFEDAHVGHGGEGALYVRIRKADDRRRTTEE